MATVNDIRKAFNILLGAGLEYPPRADEMNIRVEAWCELLPDITGPVLIQAARDIALSGERFPSVPRLREQARKVEYNHGRPAGADPAYTNRPVPPDPLRYWAEVEAETYELDAAEVLAQWRELGVKTFGDIDRWREAVAEASCIA